MPTLQEQAKAVFDKAIEIESTAEREEFLALRFDEIPQIQPRVEGLLNAYVEAGSFLESPPAGVTETEYKPVTESIGDYIGPYRLMEKIGEGGFGLVFVAEQSRPIRRKVAIKIIKPGMDTKDVVWGRLTSEANPSDFYVANGKFNGPSVGQVKDCDLVASEVPHIVLLVARPKRIHKRQVQRFRLVSDSEGLLPSCVRAHQHNRPRWRIQVFYPVVFVGLGLNEQRLTQTVGKDPAAKAARHLSEGGQCFR